MVAEQIAMADLISGGRIISGFVRGIGVETWWANSNPVHNRERFEECHDLIIKCWTEPGPFRWEGKHYHFRHVNPWCLPLQKPHPPIWVRAQPAPRRRCGPAVRGTPTSRSWSRSRSPASSSSTTARARPRPAVKSRRTSSGSCSAPSPPIRPRRRSRPGRYFEWRMGPTLRGPVEYFAPPGMRSRAGQGMALRTRPPNMTTMTYEEKVAQDMIVAGEPSTWSSASTTSARSSGSGTC